MSRIKADKFYTQTQIIRDCLKFLEEQGIHLSNFDNIIEPAAGDGAWLNYLPHFQAFDILPEDARIIQSDYFEVDYHQWIGQKNLVIGNPPFGKNSSLAVEFFNYSAQYAHLIAFIVPRTFRKASIINRLDKKFHLMNEIILPKNSFYYEDLILDVPCVFQIWSRQEHSRETLIKKKWEILDWEWCYQDDDPVWAIRRVGALAGKVMKYNNQSPSSHYFAKGNLNIDWKSFYQQNWTHNHSVKYDVAGNPSITKEEFEQALNNFIVLYPS